MSLTKKEAVEMSLKQWRWLADNPDTTKLDYFEAHNIYSEHRPTCLCYLCEETGTETIDCDACVALVHWNQEPDTNTPCTQYGSPFRGFALYDEGAAQEEYEITKSILEYRDESARAMCRMLEALLIELEEEEEEARNNGTSE